MKQLPSAHTTHKLLNPSLHCAMTGMSQRWADMRAILLLFTVAVLFVCPSAFPQTASFTAPGPLTYPFGMSISTDNGVDFFLQVDLKWSNTCAAPYVIVETCT